MPAPFDGCSDISMLVTVLCDINMHNKYDWLDGHAEMSMIQGNSVLMGYSET